MIEAENFSNWIGRVENSAPEILGQPLIDKFTAAFAPHLCKTAAAPAGVHWCLSAPTAYAAELGPDGHPAKGGLLPPVPLPRRMWAGGELTFLDPLREGDLVARSSRILDVSSKTGRSGTLCFVTVQHELTTPRGIAIQERQDIVYRAAATAPAPAAMPDTREKAEHEWQVAVDPVLLFRYSALTFNAHRIHYDESYAREVEHYPGLVIHGPLQATLMLNMATKIGCALPHRFAFRGVSPACGPQTLRIRAWESADGIELATVSAAGVTTMTGRATW